MTRQPSGNSKARSARRIAHVMPTTAMVTNSLPLSVGLQPTTSTINRVRRWPSNVRFFVKLRSMSTRFRRWIEALRLPELTSD